jgi:uncharacterized protein
MEAAVELTQKDRLFLINQYEILKRLDRNNIKVYDNFIEILTEGFEVFYHDINQWITEGVPFEDAQFVFDILSLYRNIEIYKLKNPDDIEIAGHPWAQFQGFDGNSEGAHRQFVLFLVERYNRFTEQAAYLHLTDSFNSHFPTIDIYKAMINRWKNLNVKLTTHEAILSVLPSL